ncbi:collagen alpha-1(VI) chain [Engraulis encrasicolus]|uniref:collagen alpha-1(VI) chain n=1 Tax=Engraulis encrasicolus TaxID=184585 RepID=UPI002FD4E23A
MARRGLILTALWLCSLWDVMQTQRNRNPFQDCPVDLFFVLDTSESVALRSKPPDYYIRQIQDWTNKFVDELKERHQPCDRSLTWNAGALHYSDEVQLVRELRDMQKQGEKEGLKTAVNNIKYIGKGTYTDCAIKRGIAEIMIDGSYYHENKYIVVVTDGHPETGYKEPCGGIQDAANEARQHGIKVFAVAISPDQLDTRLSIIATDRNYRQNFTAANKERDASGHMATIHTIIDIIVNETKDVCCSFDCNAKGGPKGPEGDGGHKGEAGRPGMHGEKGDVGEPGNAGDSGPVGYQGMKGDRGIRGEKGDRGHKGFKGDKGQHGIDGIDGRKGEAGFPGLPGCKGSPGPDGLQGEHGPKGDAGPYGAKGEKGEAGKEGGPGRPGNYGSNGPKGDKGPGGSDGEKGERGDDGPPGTDGDKGGPGDVGEKGEQGSRGNRGTRGEPGDPGPRGQPGREGSAGANGDPGEPGRAGLPGYRGDEGQAGPEGPRGPRGIKGAPGDRGLMGERGEDGAPGNGTVGCHGYQGDRGQEGLPGIPGAAGTPGPKGDDGEPGDPGLDNTEGGRPGQRGAKGHRGPEGPAGPPGPPGPPGSDDCEILDIIMRMCSCCECKCGPIDLTFVVDSSESIGSTNFELAKDFIITVIDRLIKDQRVQFDGAESNLGVLQYSGDKAQETVRLNSALPVRRSLAEFKQSVKDLRWLAEATYTGQALSVALKTLNLAQGKNAVVLVLTDGRSDIIRDSTPLNILCNQGVRVGGVGIKDYSGRMPNEEQLTDLACEASSQKPGFTFMRDNFAELLEDTFLQNLTAKICQDKKCPDYKCPISFETATDIGILMDSSASVGSKNYDMTKKFVKRLAERFLTAGAPAAGGRGAPVRVAVGEYGREARMSGFTTNLTQLVTQVDDAPFENMGTDVMGALSQAIQQYRSGGGGQRAKKLLLFSDGRSQGITASLIAKRVREVEEAGITLYVLAVGNQVNEGNLRDMVSRGRSYDVAYAHRHLFRAPDYNSLLRGVFYQTVSRKISLNI